MPRLLPLISLLFLQTAHFAGATSYITGEYNGTPISWPASGAGGPTVVPATVSGHAFSFTYTPTPAPAPTPSVPSVPTRSFEPPPQPTTPTKSPTHAVHTPSASHRVKHHKPAHKSHKKSKPTPTPHSPTGHHTHKGHGSSGASSGGPRVTNGGASRQTGTPQSSSSGSSLDRSTVIGLSVGFTLIALIIIAGAAFFIYRRRKARGYASAASSINEEGKTDPVVRNDEPAPFAPDAQPTLPAVMALASARNSTASLGTQDENRLSAAPSDMPVSTPWVPKTRSRLSQLQQIQQPASPPPVQHSIPRRPVGASSP